MTLTLLVYLALTLTLGNLGFTYYIFTHAPLRKKIKASDGKKTEPNPVAATYDFSEVTPPDKEKGDHNWTLDIGGEHPFDLHVEWSNGTFTRVSDLAPTNRIFKPNAGIIPVKVVGIPPRYDHKVHINWKLNGFPWS